MARAGWANGLKLSFAICSLVSLCIFFVLAIIRLDSDARNGEVGGWVMYWNSILIPLEVSFGFLLCWLLINFAIHAPISVDNAGAGGQLYYNLITQLLIRQVNTRSIENLNETLLLKDFLRLVCFSTVIIYSVVALATMTCTNCNVPYKMIAVGFLVAYFARCVMIAWNGYYSYHRLKGMAEEVRVYQEAMV